jgi:hypothetical protein
MTPNLIFKRTIFEIKKIKKLTFSKEWILKEKNEFRKNIIRSIDLSRKKTSSLCMILVKPN